MVQSMVTQLGKNTGREAWLYSSHFALLFPAHTSWAVQTAGRHSWVSQQAARGDRLGDRGCFFSTLESHNLLSGNHYLRMFTKWFMKAKEVN